MSVTSTLYKLARLSADARAVRSPTSAARRAQRARARGRPRYESAFRAPR